MNWHGALMAVTGFGKVAWCAIPILFLFAFGCEWIGTRRSRYEPPKPPSSEPEKNS